MDPSFQYHQQQYSTPQPYPSPAAPPPSSEPQSYNPHAYHHHQYNQTQQPYPYYPQTPAATHYKEPVPIHPPGVSVQSDPSGYDYGQTHVGNQQNSYYPQAGLEQQQQQLGYSDPGLQGQHWQGNEVGLIPLYSQPQSGQPQYSSAGRSGGRGGGGGPPIRGRGRGRGRGGAAALPREPSRMAWCELCRADCNTLEILEMHKNGKRHKKNLRVQEELQALAQKTQGTQMSNPQSVPEAASLPGNVVAPNGTNPQNQQAVTEGNTVLEGQASGLKRKKKSGPASKRKKTNDGSSNPADPPKPKENVPFICELCNVKCESTIVFDSHLKGKKHLFHLQRFQEHQATLGQAALQALYPALEAALLQALSQQANPNASTSAGAATGLDQQVLQLLQSFLPQAGAPPAIAPAPALEPQNQEGAAVPSSTLGDGSQNVPTDGTENQPEPETKIEEPVPDSNTARESNDTTV